MKTTIEITDGLGIVDIVTDGFALCFKNKNQPLAVDYDDYAGSIGKYISMVAGDRVELATALGNGSNEEIVNLLPELLQNFSSAHYTVVISETVSYEAYSDCPVAPKTFNYYPAEDWFLVFTQPASSLSQERIDYYVAQIEKGQRPKPLVFAESTMS